MPECPWKLCTERDVPEGTEHTGHIRLSKMKGVTITRTKRPNGKGYDIQVYPKKEGG